MSRRAGSLEQVTAEELDRTWAVNARAAVLLTQAYAPGTTTRAGEGA